MLRRIGLLLLVLFAAACQGLSSEPRIVATVPASSAGEQQDQLAATMQLGGEVWTANCAECHGRVGEGSGTPEGAPIPDLTAYTDEQILASVTNGVRDVMPAFGSRLTPEELDAAATYAKMISLAVQRGMINVGVESTPEVSSTAEVAELAAQPPPAVPGVVVGQVANGTEGGTLPPDITLTLHVIESELSEQSFDTGIGADGSYRFENVPFDAAYQYVITAPYGDVQYVSEIASVDPSVPELTLPINIYESGATAEDVTITGIDTQIMVSGGLMQVIQIASFHNTSDRVYFSVTDGFGSSVSLRIPPDATMLNRVSERYRVEGNTIIDSRPFLPGQTHLIHVAWSLPYGSNALVQQSLDYAVNGAFNLVMATEGLSANGDGFAAQTPITSGGRTYPAYGGTFDLDAGGALRFEVTGAPVVVASTSEGSVNTLTPFAYILIGAGISALLIAAVLLIRERATRAGTDTSKTAVASLMEQIAALDSRHQAGQIKTNEYNRQRSALKAQLTALMKTQ